MTTAALVDAYQRAPRCRWIRAGDRCKVEGHGGAVYEFLGYNAETGEAHLFGGRRGRVPSFRVVRAELLRRAPACAP